MELIRKEQDSVLELDVGLALRRDKLLRIRQCAGRLTCELCSREHFHEASTSSTGRVLPSILSVSVVQCSWKLLSQMVNDVHEELIYVPDAKQGDGLT